MNYESKQVQGTDMVDVGGYSCGRDHLGRNHNEGETVPKKSKTLKGHRSKVSSCSIGARAAARRIQNSWRSFVLLVLILVLAANTITLGHIFNVILNPSGQLVQRLPSSTTHMLPMSRSLVQEETAIVAADNLGRDLLSVRDIVAFPDEVMMLVVSAAAAEQRTILTNTHNLECLFGNQYKTGVFTVAWKDDHRSILAVRCKHPYQPLLGSKQATVVFRDSKSILPSTAQYVTNSSWKPLVYETVTLPDSVLLFVKGLVNSHGRPHNYSQSLDKLKCCFGSNASTSFLGMHQEVARCELPSEKDVRKFNLQGVKVSLFVNDLGVLPSVAYFDKNIFSPDLYGTIVRAKEEKMFHICSCTMLWNQAQFLREWIMYHGFLGVERWFLYDNNSEDEIEDVLAVLLSMKYNVSRHTWPWIKTQEAGFSHCALRARADCEWVVFIDIDEFVFPHKDLQDLVSGDQNSSTALEREILNSKSNLTSLLRLPAERLQKSHISVLQTVIERTLQEGERLGKKVGEVRLLCRDFGPSGLVRVPEGGVMVGYTCRLIWAQRHKSFLLLDAMSDTLQNVVHHFALREGYEAMVVPIEEAVINHYKYQVWEVFKAKFVRRVSTYVVDWREQTAASKDRAPGLGLDAVEPEDWSSRYCEVEDLELRNFTWNMFKYPETNLMAWQLHPNERWPFQDTQLK